MKAITSLRIVIILSACVVILYASDDVIREDGDVMLASLFEVNEAIGDGTCGTFDLQGVRDVYAVQWFVRKLNQLNYIPNVTIGLEAWRTCFSRVKAMRASFQLVDSYLTNTSAHAPLAGIVGPSRTDPAMAVSAMFTSLPEGQRVPQVSGSATGIALGNKDTYSNFFRVIPPDDSQIQVMTELLLSLRWNYIAIVYTEEEYGTRAAADLQKEAKRRGVCVPFTASLPTDTSGLEFQKAVGDIAQSLNGKPSAGVSSSVRGLVFIGGTRAARHFALRLNTINSFVKIIFSEALALQRAALQNENQDSIIGVTQGALTVTPRYREVGEFRQAWNSLWTDCSRPGPEVTENAWLTGLKEQHSDCTHLQLGHREQMLFTWYHVQAAAMLAAALKSLHSDACKNASGPCPEFLSRVQDYHRIRDVWADGLDLEAEFGQIVASFKGMTEVSFDDEGEAITQSSKPLYEIHNLRSCLDNDKEFCFVKVGDNAGGPVSLNQTLMRGYSSGQPRPWQEVDRAQCGAGTDCPECLEVKPCDAAQIIPGHFYFVAVAPVHSRDPDDSLECGAARPNLGADFVQAIHYALEEVNTERGRWGREMGGRRLGAIILDSCYSPLVVKNKLLQLHKGHIMTPHGPLNETYVKDVLLKRIAGYIGGFFSLISFAMSDVLTKLDRKAYVHLSPTSVAPDLSDRHQHPYFLRLTVPANSEILAMMDLLKTLSATFVQIIYDPVDAYSADLTKEFQNRAAEHQVCVAQKIEAPLQSDPSFYSGILRQLRQKSSARMVIVILQYEQILQVMNYLIGSSNKLKADDSFVFLGTEAWARRPQIIQGKQRLAGSITIAEEIAVDSRFTAYFRGVDPVNTTNFWLREFWGAIGQCYFDLSFRRKGKSVECSSSIQETYSQDPWVSYFIQAVYAFASGVGKALGDTCPRSQDDICSSLTASVLVDYLKQVKLDLFSQGREQRVFDANGDGENGYKIMQAYWDSTDSAMKYRQIGTWTAGGRLALSVSVTDLYTKLPVDIAVRNYNSSCSNDVECQSCPSSKSEKITEKDEKTVPMIPAVVVIALLALLVIFLIVLMVVLVRRMQRVIYKSRPSTEIRFENDGLSSMSSTGTSRQPVQELAGQGDPNYPHHLDRHFHHPFQSLSVGSGCDRHSPASSDHYECLGDAAAAVAATTTTTTTTTTATTTNNNNNDPPSHVPPPQPCSTKKLPADYLTVAPH